MFTPLTASQLLWNSPNIRAMGKVDPSKKNVFFFYQITLQLLPLYHSITKNTVKALKYPSADAVT